MQQPACPTSVYRQNIGLIYWHDVANIVPYFLYWLTCLQIETPIDSTEVINGDHGYAIC